LKIIYSLFNVANALSVARIFFAIPLYYSLKNISAASSLSDIYMFLWVCLFIALSDILDGFFARYFKTVTDTGKFLDPFADKVCVLVFILFLSSTVSGYFILFVALFIRDLIITFFSIYFVKKEGRYFQANVFGKWFLFFIGMSMIFSILTIPDVIISENTYLYTINDTLYVLSWIFFILSTYRYFSMYINLLRR